MSSDTPLWVLEATNLFQSKTTFDELINYKKIHTQGQTCAYIFSTGCQGSSESKMLPVNPSDASPINYVYSTCSVEIHIYQREFYYLCTKRATTMWKQRWTHGTPHQPPPPLLFLLSSYPTQCMHIIISSHNMWSAIWFEYKTGCSKRPYLLYTDTILAGLITENIFLHYLQQLLCQGI